VGEVNDYHSPLDPKPKKPINFSDGTVSKVPLYDGQCEALTKKGFRCLRNAEPGSRFCYQHGG